MSANLLTLNSSKTEYLIIGLKQQLSKIDYSSLNTTHSARNLGFILMNILLSLIRSHHFLSPAILIFVSSRCIRPYLDSKTDSTIAASIVHSKLEYCNSFYYNPPKSQINRLQQIQNCLHVLWLKLLNLLISHPSSDLCIGSRLMNALNVNSCHSPTKFLQPANLTTYTILSLFSLQVELVPCLLSP